MSHNAHQPDETLVYIRPIRYGFVKVYNDRQFPLSFADELRCIPMPDDSLDVRVDVLVAKRNKKDGNPGSDPRAWWKELLHCADDFLPEISLTEGNQELLNGNDISARFTYPEDVVSLTLVILGSFEAPFKIRKSQLTLSKICCCRKRDLAPAKPGDFIWMAGKTAKQLNGLISRGKVLIEENVELRVVLGADGKSNDERQRK
jgi:hypothetical protein